MSALLQAVDALNARLITADTIGQSLQAVAGDQDPPAWVYVYREQLEAVRNAAEAVECLVRQGETA
jgi:hypothetical protein